MARSPLLTVEQGILLAVVLSLILHVKRHYTPADRVVTWDEHGRLRLQRRGIRWRPSRRSRDKNVLVIAAVMTVRKLIP